MSILVLAGAGAGTVPVSGLISVNTTVVGNVGGGTDNLMTYSLPANSLSSNGRGVRITAWGATANNGNAKTLDLLFGATVLTAQAMTTSIAGRWWIQSVVFRTGSNAQDYTTYLRESTTTFGTTNDRSKIVHGTLSQTDSGAITIKCTGAATSNNDITQEGMLIEWFN